MLDHGRLVKQETHETLVTAGGVYARLAALQKQGTLEGIKKQLGLK